MFDRSVGFSGLEPSPWAADGSEYLEVLYGYSSDKRHDLLGVRDQFSGDQLPLHLLAIGQVTGANLVCLDLRATTLGRIYLWGHEHLDDDRAGLYLVTESFTKFVDSLVAKEIAQPENGPKMVKAELSQTLRMRAAELIKKKAATGPR